MSAREDCVLVAAVARQQQQALDQLYTRYSTMVYCLALKVLQSHENAEEVVGEVFWQVWCEAARYDAQRSSVRTWLGTLLTRADINDLPVATDPAENPEEQISRQQRALLVRDALESLPANQRAVLELAFFSGLSHAEIATHLALPLGTVKTRIRGALLCLRERLSDVFFTVTLGTPTCSPSDAPPGVKVERNEVERNCSLWGGGDYGRILWRCGSTRLAFHIYNNLRGVVISRSCGSIDPCSYGEKNTPADVCCRGSFRRRGDLHGGVRKPLLLTTHCHVAIGTMNRDGTRRRWDIPNAFTVLELTHGTRAAERRYRQALIRAADHRSAPREKGQG